MIEDFCVFILTHGRAGNVKTWGSLQKHGYTGPTILVLDDEDDQIPQYVERFGAANIEIFNKDEVARRFDRGDNFGKKGAIIYARNACFDIARKRGYKYFIELDDDYTSFTFRFDGELNYVETQTKNVENIWRTMLEYYKATPQLTTIAMAQGGDFIGGGVSSLGRCVPKRKAITVLFAAWKGSSIS